MTKENKSSSRLLARIAAFLLALSMLILCGCSLGDLGLTKHEIAAGETPDVNPLKGFFPFATDADFPYSLEWFYLPVNAVHLAPGEFDWSALEYRLNMVASRGHQAVVRFYYDYPGDESGIPQFLLDAGLKVRAYNEPVDLGGGGMCPDYSDPIMLESMQEFIAAFGEKYDGDARIGFITEGLLGFWGEWHNWPFDEDIADGKPNWKISAELYEAVYQAFDNAFDTTLLLVREPKAEIDDAKYGTGYHDDSFAYATLSKEKGGQEWSYMSKMINEGVENTWEIAPIGGEVYPPLQSEYFMEEYFCVAPNAATDPSADMINRQDWYACIDESHASFLVCDAIKNYRGTTKENAIEASKSLGYNMQVSAAYYADSIKSTGALKLNVDIKNIGVAPFYYDHNTWPVLIGIKQDGVLVKQYETEWNISDIPATGEDVKFKHTVNDHGLGGGEYTICIKVRNPLAGGIVFSFANEGMNEDGWLELGTITVEGESAGAYEPINEAEFVVPVEPVDDVPLVDGAGGHYQAEAGVMEGVAVFEECTSAEGQMLAGWVGSGVEGSGSVTMENVIVAEDGFYTVDVDYVCGEAFRLGMFDINGGAANGGSTVTYRFNSTGSWSVLDTRHTVLFLKAGPNSIKFYNDTSWAPSIDCITVTRGSTNGIQTMDADLSDWSESIESVLEDDFFNVRMTTDDAYIYAAIEIKDDANANADWRIKLNALGKGIDYEVRPDGLYSVSGDAEPEKIAEEGTSTLHIARNGNTIEFMLLKGAIETTRKQLGYDLGFIIEFSEGGKVIHTSNGGEIFNYELVSGALRMDKTRRFIGGKYFDWSTTDCSYMDLFQNIWATDDENNLYFACEFNNAEGLYKDWSLELNTDADCNTGYAMDWIWYWESAGSDYRVDANGLYCYTADGELELIADSSDSEAFTYTYGDGKLEIKISKDRLNTSSSKVINFSIVHYKNPGEWHTAEIAGGNGGKMGAFTQNFVTEPRYSGLNSMYGDWSEVPALEIAGNHKIWLADDEEYLYIAAEYRYDDIVKWEILMDTDYKRKTGMQSDWPFSPGGADYLAEGDMTNENTTGVLGYQEVTDGNWTFGKKFDDAVSCVVDTQNKTVEIRILKSALNNPERKLVDIVNFGLRFIASNGDAVASSSGGKFMTYKMMTK